MCTVGHVPACWLVFCIKTVVVSALPLVCFEPSTLLSSSSTTLVTRHPTRINRRTRGNLLQQPPRLTRQPTRTLFVSLASLERCSPVPLLEGDSVLHHATSSPTEISRAHVRGKDAQIKRYSSPLSLHPSLYPALLTRADACPPPLPHAFSTLFHTNSNRTQTMSSSQHLGSFEKESPTSSLGYSSSFLRTSPPHPRLRPLPLQVQMLQESLLPTSLVYA